MRKPTCTLRLACHSLVTFNSIVYFIPYLWLNSLDAQVVNNFILLWTYVLTLHLRFLLCYYSSINIEYMYQIQPRSFLNRRQLKSAKCEWRHWVERRVYCTMYLSAPEDGSQILDYTHPLFQNTLLRFPWQSKKDTKMNGEHVSVPTKYKY